MVIAQKNIQAGNVLGKSWDCFSFLPNHDISWDQKSVSIKVAARANRDVLVRPLRIGLGTYRINIQVASSPYEQFKENLDPKPIPAL